MQRVRSLAKLAADGGISVKPVSSVPVGGEGDVALYGNRLWVGGTVSGFPAMLPANQGSPAHVHAQGTASNFWVVSHNLDCAGMPTVVARDGAGNLVEPIAKTVISRNQINLTFAGQITGSAVVVFDGVTQVDDLRVGGKSVSTVDHGHAFSALSGRPTTLSGYGITDALPLAQKGAANGVATLDANGLVTTSQLPALPMSVTAQSSIIGWNDITSDLVAKSSGSSSPTLTLFAGLIYAYQFSASQIQQLFSTFHIPHDYAPGSAFHLHIHWSDTAASPTGVTRWGFEYIVAKGHGQEAFPTTTKTVYVEQAAVGSRYHMVAESVAITDPSVEVDSLILVRVFRDASHVNDTNPNPVFAFTADVHYQVDRVATKNRAPNFYA
jgi:hypothetical protein